MSAYASVSAKTTGNALDQAAPFRRHNHRLRDGRETFKPHPYGHALHTAAAEILARATRSCGSSSGRMPYASRAVTMPPASATTPSTRPSDPWRRRRNGSGTCALMGGGASASGETGRLPHGARVVPAHQGLGRRYHRHLPRDSSGPNRRETRQTHAGRGAISRVGPAISFSRVRVFDPASFPVEFSPPQDHR